MMLKPLQDQWVPEGIRCVQTCRTEFQPVYILRFLREEIQHESHKS